jgi:hypothetical protein
LFRFTIIWEQVIVIIEERWPVAYHASLGDSEQGDRSVWEGKAGGISEQVWLPRIRLSWLAQGAGTASSFHGQDQDQEGLIKMAVIELRSFAEAFNHQIVSEFQIVENAGSWSHKFRCGWMRGCGEWI